MRKKDRASGDVNRGHAFRNQLLQALSPEDISVLAPQLNRVTLRPRQLLHVSRTPMERVYFIENSLISVSGPTGQGKMVEAWLIGSEGMSGIPVVLHDDAPPLQRMVQVGGEAFEIGRNELIAAMDASPGIRQLLLRYVEFVLLQTVQTGICNANHDVEQRLSRWLLIARDALGQDRVPLTHRALARTLGVRRASVTNCLGLLEKRRAIGVSRGVVIADDPDALNEIACDCTRFIKREYQRLITDFRPDTKPAVLPASGTYGR
jgi:CRP-like cAMP-binding protein